MSNLTWARLDEDGPMPLSMILILTVTAGHGLLLLSSGVRRLKHSLSATKNMVVAKKMQHFQAWAYSFFYNLVQLSTLFTAISLFVPEFDLPKLGGTGAVLLVLVGLQTLAVSQVDVIGTEGRSPGINDISVGVSGQYLGTFYLPKVVWKLSGHTEFGDSSSGKSSFSKTLGSLFCMQPMSNHITPKVYDIKDVVGIQGAFLSLPALLVYLMTFVIATPNDVTTEAVINGTAVEVLTSQASSIQALFEGNAVLKLAGALSAISAVLPPILADWETSKNIFTGAGSVLVRSAELVGRLSFYAYFIDGSRFGGLAALVVEIFWSNWTYVTFSDFPTGGRLYATSNAILAAVESTFFGFYRRISVDKDLTIATNDMPVAIELLRFVSRTVITAVGYFTVLGLGVPESWSDFNGLTALPAFFFAGVAANLAVTAYYTVVFAVMRRKEIKGSDFGRLWDYWKGFYPCRKTCCAGNVIHVNRDNNMGNINYV